MSSWSGWLTSSVSFQDPSTFKRFVEVGRGLYCISSVCQRPVAYHAYSRPPQVRSFCWKNRSHRRNHRPQPGEHRLHPSHSNTALNPSNRQSLTAPQQTSPDKPSPTATSPSPRSQSQSSPAQQAQQSSANASRQTTSTKNGTSPPGRRRSPSSMRVGTLMISSALVSCWRRSSGGMR